MNWFIFIKKGTILYEPGANPKPHELISAEALISMDDVIFLREKKLYGENTPDIIWLGFKWEIKAPRSKGKYTIQNDITDALHQSKNIIIDLFRYPLPEIAAIKRIKREVKGRKEIKRLCYINKKRKIIVLK